MRSIQYIPRATEKAYGLEGQHVYVFFVPMKASKQEIAKRIAEDFKVTVLDVKTAIRKGKPTRFSRGRHAYPGITTRQDKKVAYVTVKDTDKIPVFQEETQAEDKKADKKEAKTEKAEKKAEKKPRAKKVKEEKEEK